MGRRYWYGLTAAILSAVFFGFLPFTAIEAYREGLTPSALLFYRFGLSIPLIYLYTKYAGINLAISAGDARRVFLLVTAGTGITALLLFMSYQYISTGIATVLHFSYAVFVLLGAALFFKEKLYAAHVLAVAMALGGAWLCIPWDGGGSLFGFAIALLSGVTYTFYILYMGHSSLRNMEAPKLALYICLMTAPLLGLYSAAAGEFIIPETLRGWLYCMLSSFMGTTMGVCLFQYGVKLIGGTRASICSTMEPITSLFLGIWLLGEQQTIETVAGTVMILAAVGITVWKDSQKETK